MVKINVEFDTKDKVLNIMMDGKSMENVGSIEFYKGWDDDEKFHGSITTIEKVDDEDYTKIMRISAEHGVVEVTESSNIHKILANRLFRKRVV
uniref:Uncharacterized protein n=1 Tax=viral metagenome TaxID=1070528 RepID=A0A6M3K5U8_9ZZZZ